MSELYSNYRRTAEEKISNNFLISIIVSHVAIAFFYGIFLFLYEIKFLRNIIPTLHLLLIGWALVIIAYDLVIRRIWRVIPYWTILLGFLVITGITSIVNYEAGIVSNLKSMIMILIPLAIFYPVCMLEKPEERKKAIAISLGGASVVTFFASSIALVMFMKRFSERITFMGQEELVGIRHYIESDPTSAIILYGLYVDTNHAAIYSLVFAVFSIFLLWSCHTGVFQNKIIRTIVRIYAIVNLCVQMCYFPLANSRGGWLCLFTAGIIVLFLFLSLDKLKNEKISKRIIVSIVVSIGCLLVLCVGILGIRTGLSKASIWINTRPLEQTVEENTEANVVETEIADVVETTDAVKKEEREEVVVQESFEKTDDGSGAGRLVIWKDALELFKRKPILGTGAGNNQYYAQKYEIDSYKLTTGAALHNSYLDLLVDYGVVGAGIMIVFLICNVIAIVKTIRKNELPDKFTYYCFSFSVLLISGAALLLSCLFISTTAMYYLMLLLMGYLISYYEKKRN